MVSPRSILVATSERSAARDRGTGFSVFYPVHSLLRWELRVRHSKGFSSAYSPASWPVATKPLLKVEPLEGEWFRFLVHSESGEGGYLVDLEENDFAGQCDCPHFQCRLAPRIREGVKIHCKHIKAARDVWFDKMARKLASYVEKT